MEPYKEMYYKLFHLTTKAIKDLKQAQRETEEMFLSADNSSIRPVEIKTRKDHVCHIRAK